LRTQQICAYETGVTKVADPLGGSYYVESLTEDLEKEIAQVIQTIEKMGGAVTAIEKGYMQQCIANEAYRVAMEEKNGQRLIVGVNKFRLKESANRKMTFHRFDPAMAARQTERTREVRKNRDNQRVLKALNSLRDEARGESNLLPCLIETVKTYATIGEITGVLKEVFGSFQEPLMI